MSKSLSLELIVCSSCEEIFLFLEHDLSDVKNTYFLQNRFNPFKKMVSAYYLKRDINELVDCASFEISSLNCLQLQLVVSLIGHCHLGVCR